MYSNAIIEKTSLEEGRVSFNSYHNLPGNRVLYLSSDDAKTVFTLKIFAEDDLTTSLKTRTFYTLIDFDTDLICEYELVCLFSNGIILLHKRRCYKTRRHTSTLLRICSLTLEILKEDDFYHQLWLTMPIVASQSGSEQFFIIKYARDTPDSDLFLIIYEWSGNYYKTKSVTKILSCSESRIDKIIALENNTFACLFLNDDVLLIEVNPETHVIKEFGVIQPQKNRCNSLKIKALPNRQLLTYRDFNEEAQIWDIDTKLCIKEWSWKTICTFEDFKLSRISIYPFPDSKYFLVKKGDSLYILNTDSLSLKKVIFFNTDEDIMLIKNTEHKGGYNFSWFASDELSLHKTSILILSSGKVWSYKSVNGTGCNRLLFDLEEFAHERKIKKEFKDSVMQTIVFLYRHGFPEELVRLIFRDVFDPEIQANSVEKEEDEIYQYPSCVLI